MSNNEFTENLSQICNPEEYDETYKSYTADLNLLSAVVKVLIQSLNWLVEQVVEYLYPNLDTYYSVDLDAAC